jgi:hypothetical protein
MTRARSGSRGPAEQRRVLVIAAACMLVMAGGPVLDVTPCEALTVAPHALFIDHRTRSGVLYLQNSGDAPEEFAIHLQFGYPVSDSLGGVYVELFDEVPAGAPSAATWVRALPARAIVQPGERQAVRLLAMPPANLPDGEYWSRIIIESRTVQRAAPLPGEEDVMVGLTLKMRTITSLTYRKGEVITGVHVEDVQASLGDGQVNTDIRLQRRGNGAYLGKLIYTLTDTRGRAVEEWQQAIAVYHHLHRRLSFPVSDLGPGEYRLRVELSTDRDDIAPRDVLQVEPVERVVPIAVRGGSG